MEKENGDSGGDGKNGGAPQGAPQGTSDQNALLDAASLFGAYWPRDGSASSLFPGGFHTGLGAFGLPPARNAQFPSAPHPHPSTMAVAASQAASLGMHPAASAAWWSMASHLAAQDYLSRLQASGIGFTPPDLQYPLLTAPPAPKSSSKSSKSSKNQKEKSSASPNLVPTSSTSSSYQKQAITTAYNSHKNYSSSMSAAVNSLSSSSASSRSERTVCSPSTLSVTNKGKMTPKASTPVKEDPLPASHTKIQSSPRPRDPVPPPATMSLLSAALEGGDPSAILGVRLPPDTEIIKYTSSIVGPKIPGTTNRGRKKTISLDPPSVSLTATMSSTGIPLHKMKRARMDSDYSNLQNAHQNDRVEVIKLPPSLSTPNGGPPNPPLIHKHMISLLTKPLSDPDHRNLLSETSNESGLNLTVTSGLGDKDDAPLNLSLKPQSEVNSSLNSLSNITAAVGNSSGNSSGDRVSRRKPGAKPRRVIQEPLAPPSGVSVMSTMSPIASITPEPTRAMASLSESPRPSSGSEENDIHSVAAHSKEGRPRNLGRGVSKPKKNTVASLLAQSRALGIKPMLATQYLADDLEKLRQALGESAGTLDASTDSEGPADGDGESEGEDPSPQLLEMLRFPLERGWKRETIIRGLTRNGGIRGEVTYYAPASTTKLKHMSQVTPLLDHTGFTRDHFSFSSRPIVGWFLQPAPPHLATDGEFIRMSEETVLRRLEELKALARHGMPTLNVDHRIELARQQQALRDAKKQAREDLARSKEMARNAREQERTERLETQRKERELRNQQVIEARKKRQDELDKQRLEEQQRKQQERELKRQQSVMLKEQMYLQELNKQKELLYTVELERERRRQHMAHVKSLETRRKYEDREKRKHQGVLDKLLNREKRLAAQRKDAEILGELRKPMEDSELPFQTQLPELSRVSGLRICGQALGDLLMVFEFLHNFGETLGFDMESLPTLHNLQLALEGDCGTEPEEELLSVMTHLLVCAIEDPGIPNPARHTTILGQSLRQADITHSNLSEILRIYLYANATGEVKALTGVNFERDREKRVADHLQNDSEMVQTTTGKNAQFYEHLHENSTWKLSESLKDCPFLALSPTVKAQILAFICNELLQNKAVLRQIEGSLESVAQLKKEKYLLDGKIRKYKSLHSRKLRLETHEKAQALAAEKAQALRNESLEGVTASDRPMPPPTPEATPLPTPSAPSEGFEEEPLSDVESEVTQPEEDEDKNMSAEELARKLERLQRSSSTQSKGLQSSCKQLRATCHGQDRYWRRYWSLPTCGSVWIEAMESAQPEIMEYHSTLEGGIKREADDEEDEIPKKRGRKKGSTKGDKSKCETDAKPSLTADQIQSELELQSIKSSLNLSDHTQIIKYEPNIKPGPKEEGPIKMEEKYIQHKKEETSDMLDIEDSIPTAFLVQKPNSNKHMFLDEMMAKNENNIKLMEAKTVDSNVKMETDIKSEDVKSGLMSGPDLTYIKIDDVKLELNNENEINLGEIKNCDTVKDANSNEQKVIDTIDKLIKKPEDPIKVEEKSLFEQKWFSLLQKEIPLVQSEGGSINQQAIVNSLNVTCDEVHNVAGNRWDISNNLQFFNLSGINGSSSTVTVPVFTGVNLDSSLSLSGLDDSLIDSVINKISLPQTEDPTPMESEQEPVDQKDLKSASPHSVLDDSNATVNSSNTTLTQAPTINVPSFVNLSLSSLSAYVQCDSPSPLQMTAEEQKQLESVKANGLPKKIERNFVSREYRHGWWRISDANKLRELVDRLHPRGVRERELRSGLLSTVEENGELHIDLGEQSTYCLGSSGKHNTNSLGYIHPDIPGSKNPSIAQRVDLLLLEQVEALEDKVANASMQIKGWCVPGRDEHGSECVSALRERLLGLEGAIERRYLKPPLGANTGDPNLAAITQETTGVSSCNINDPEAIPKGLVGWREAVTRCHTSAQLAMCLYMLEACVAWDKSIMRAVSTNAIINNCQFCHSGDSEDQLLLCDGCDKGYHTYCFKPKMDRIPDGDWYCFECLNKATGERNCIVCGGRRSSGEIPQPGRVLLCELCPRAYHQDCHIPPLLKAPRGKWYCSGCISKAPPGKKRKSRVTKPADIIVHEPPPSPALSYASTSYEDPQLNDHNQQAATTTIITKSPSPSENASIPASTPIPLLPPIKAEKPDKAEIRKERQQIKKITKELASCKILLEEMETHEDSWPFLLPVNTKQFPTYKKIIKAPMDLSTIKKRLTDLVYKSRDDFVNDVRQIFNNCEVFNEDDSPVGKAGHGMRRFFEERWTELCPDKS